MCQVINLPNIKFPLLDHCAMAMYKDNFVLEKLVLKCLGMEDYYNYHLWSSDSMNVHTHTAEM